MEAQYILEIIGLCLAGVCILYFSVLLILLNVSVQRQALYAHRIKAWWQDLDHPEQWGFLTNQIRPFTLKTSDHETLYAWHIVPISVYAKSEEDLLNDPTGSEGDVTKTAAFRLLSKDSDTRLVISFHGNAGHVAQGWRTDTYRALSAGAADKIHVLTMDYRGFGRSTGSPTEDGLIIDGIALVQWAIEVANIPAERIVIVGQSLGTAVATAVMHYYTERTNMQFAGVVLIAAFSNLPDLLLTYAAGSIIPVLSPLRIFPRVQKIFARRVQDSWRTDERLAQFVRNSDKLNLVLIHAVDDWDIPWAHSNTLFCIAANAVSNTSWSPEDIDDMQKHTDLGRQGWKNTWPDGTRRGGKKNIQQIILKDGGHNRICTYAPVIKAVFELFEI